MIDNLKRYFKYLIILEVVILAGFFISIIKFNNNTEFAPSLDYWQSNYIEYGEDAWYVNENSVHTNEKIDIIYGPYLEMGKGTYTINVRYKCEFEQEGVAFAGSGNDVYIKAGTLKLKNDQTAASFNVKITDKIENFEVVIKYNGHGMLQIENISILKNSVGLKNWFIYLFSVFLVFDIVLLFYDTIKRNKNLFLALGGILLFTSIPLLIKGIASEPGQDLPFHIMRIEGIAQELQKGIMPVRQSSLFMDGYGYPTSIYYGDLLLYLPALLRIAGFSVVTSYKIYVFLINVLTVAISYLCFNRIFQDKSIAFITCLAYVTAPYRLLDIYTRSAVGEYTAIMFFPIVALAIYSIYTEDYTDWGNYKRWALLLAIGMSGLITTHVLSTEMIVFILFLFCIALWKKTIKINVVKVFLLAVVETLALSLYFIIPFVDYYFNVLVNINDTVAGGVTKKIQNSGTYIGDYLLFFRDINGLDSIDVKNRMQLTPGIVLMIALIIALVIVINKKASKEVRLLTVFAILTLFIASNLFPWNHLARYKIGNLLAQVQFPWRYISIAIVFLTLLLGYILKQNINRSSANFAKITGILASICMIMSCVFASSYSDSASMMYSYDTSDLNLYYIGSGEYLRLGSSANSLTHKIEHRGMKQVDLCTRNGSFMELYCEGTNVDGYVEIPIFNYKGFHVVDDAGVEYEIADGTNNVISFTLPPRFSGKIIIDFIEPWYWRLAEIISLVSVIICLFRYKFLFKRRAY